MPRSVGVIFELRQAEARPGETLRVTGAGPELGAWGAEDVCGLRLRTSVSVYPLWTMLEPVWIDLPDDGEDTELWLEYKYVRDLGPWAEADKRTVWEDGIANRRVEIPRGPGVWVVSDAQWESLATPPELRPTLEGEIGRRRGMLDPDPVTLPATLPRLIVGSAEQGQAAAGGRPPPLPKPGCGQKVYCMTPSQTSPRRGSAERYPIEAEYDKLSASGRQAKASPRGGSPAPSGTTEAAPCPSSRASPARHTHWGMFDAAPGPALTSCTDKGPTPASRCSPEVSGREQANPEVAGNDWQVEVDQLRRENEELKKLLLARAAPGSAAEASVPPLPGCAQPEPAAAAAGLAPADCAFGNFKRPASPTPEATPPPETELMKVLSLRRERLEASIANKEVHVAEAEVL